MAAYQHILFAADLAEDADQVGRRAVDLARRTAARLSLIHVVEHLGPAGSNELAPPAMPLQLGGAAPAIPPKGTDDDVVQNARQFLDRLAERLGVVASQRWVVASHFTKREIHRVAKEQDVDLIVVGSHGRHGLALLLGSTADAVLHGAPCDVLAVRVARTESLPAR